MLLSPVYLFFCHLGLWHHADLLLCFLKSVVFRLYVQAIPSPECLVCDVRWGPLRPCASPVLDCHQLAASLIVGSTLSGALRKAGEGHGTDLPRASGAAGSPGTG